MSGFAKSILVSIIIAICILLFTNLVFFFPWYTTMIIETFNVSQVVASDNYLKRTYYDDAMERLKERPIYSQKADDIKIVAENESGQSVLGEDDASVYEDLPEGDKPYKQRGEPVKVTIRAVYPLSIELWGKKYEQEIPVSFSLTTTGLKHYKDLEYYEYLDQWDEAP
ncbi:hypothetical protein [Paenibacillus caui]|uniref:hypothetical protein n=1 Tax=Paenibacillus caui TaxID=2873927 RepID=UPI001CA868BD|nr:hypothetical protein [Paenibacillus caui]